MKTRLFFILCLICIFIGLALHASAREKGIESSKIRMRSFGLSGEKKQEMVAEAELSKSKAQRQRAVGLVFSGASFICFVVARRRREPGWYTVPVLLWFFDFLLFVML